MMTPVFVYGGCQHIQQVHLRILNARNGTMPRPVIGGTKDSRTKSYNFV